jgi:hypothetical protein
VKQRAAMYWQCKYSGKVYKLVLSFALFRNSPFLGFTQ